MMRSLAFILLFISGDCFSQKNDSVAVILKKSEPYYAFAPGDIIISPNIGWPHVTPALIKTGIYAYDRIVPDNGLSYTLTSRGVYNLKTEYALMDNLGLGLAASYWDMKINLYNDYVKDGGKYHDSAEVAITAQAFGVRGNFHLTDETESTWIDLYVGGTLGATNYKKRLEYGSTNPGRQLNEAIPEKILNFRDGWLTYFSTTFGARIYPQKNIGLNAEVGWDRGAFLFGGLVFRFNTPPIKSLQD